MRGRRLPPSLKTLVSCGLIGGAIVTACLGAVDVIGGRLARRARERCGQSTACWEEAWLAGHDSLGRSGHDGYRHDPLLGWASAAWQRPRASDYSQIHTDAHGARGRRDHPFVRDGGGGGPRVVALGDSFTFGVCVDDDDTWPGRLEAALPGSDVVNLGVPGYGIDQEVLQFERDGVRYRPDVVVLGYYRDDVLRCDSSFFSFAKPRFVLEGDRLALTGVPVPTPDALAARAHAPWSRLRRRAAVIAEQFVRPRSRRPTVANALARRLIVRLAASVRRIGARLVVLYLPGHVPDESGALEEFRGLCRSTGVECLDPTLVITRLVTSQPRDDWFRCHYRPEIHAAIAAFVAEHLTAPRAARGRP